MNAVRERNAQRDALPELGKRIVADVEKQWGWIRGPRPANIVVKKKKLRRKK